MIYIKVEYLHELSVKKYQTQASIFSYVVAIMYDTIMTKITHSALSELCFSSFSA